MSQRIEKASVTSPEVLYRICSFVERNRYCTKEWWKRYCGVGGGSAKRIELELLALGFIRPTPYGLTPTKRRASKGYEITPEGLAWMADYRKALSHFAHRPLIDAPVKLAPDAESCDARSVLLTWSPVLGALRYQFEIAMRPDMGNAVKADVAEEACWMSNPDVPFVSGTYYWRVRALNERWEGPWSTVASFIIGDGPREPAQIPLRT